MSSTMCNDHYDIPTKITFSELRRLSTVSSTFVLVMVPSTLCSGWCAGALIPPNSTLVNVRFIATHCDLNERFVRDWKAVHLSP